MPIRITQECVNCAACVDVCPNNGIRRGHSAYVINQDMCTECVGFFNEPQCVSVCPTDCCVTDSRIVLSEEVLFERARSMQANSGKQLTLTAATSHFRKASKSQSPASESFWERLFGKKTPTTSPALPPDNA